MEIFVSRGFVVGKDWCDHPMSNKKTVETVDGDDNYYYYYLLRILSFCDFNSNTTPGWPNDNFYDRTCVNITDKELKLDLKV